MSTSSAVTVKTALVALLGARPALAGVQVSYVWQGDATEQDCIYLGNVRGGNEYPVIRAGRKPRQETYTFDLFARALRPDAWASDAEARVVALLAEVEDAIADDPQIGLAATHPTLWLLVVRWDLVAEPFGDGGWAARLRAEIEVHSRLT